jgi:hypothetical protein
MHEKTNNELMQFSSLPSVKVLMLLQSHIPSQIALCLQDALGVLLCFQLLQDLGLMSLSSSFSGSILEIQMIYCLSQAWNTSLPPSSLRLQPLFVADLAERLPLVPNPSQKRPLMFGLLWMLSQMEESVVCFACM